jgi:hypothetical protein
METARHKNVQKVQEARRQETARRLKNEWEQIRAANRDNNTKKKKSKKRWWQL